jgi:hypothetical protein
MSVATINNHVLFAQDADWRFAPDWKRRWQTEVSASVTGSQSRRSLRSVARHSLTFQITPTDLNEQVRLDDALRQAKKTGLACAPLHGRACRIEGSFTGTELICGRGWDWQAGDYVHVANDTGYEVAEVESADYDEGDELWTLTLADALIGNYINFVRPILFGKFDCTEMTAITPTLGPVRITISELVSSRSVQIGVTPVAADGIGVMALETTFEVA